MKFSENKFFVAHKKEGLLGEFIEIKSHVDRTPIGFITKEKDFGFMPGTMTIAKLNELVVFVEWLVTIFDEV
jgi:hypothetical protein